MDDKELIKFPDDPLGAAIQNFALYARGEGSFDELDLKEAIFALHEADMQRVVRKAQEKAYSKAKGYFIGFNKNVIEWLDNDIAQLSKEDGHE